MSLGSKTKGLTAMPFLCSRCGENMRDYGWTKGPVYHCEGSTIAFGARKESSHHTQRQWPNCWKCREIMGCATCATSDVRAVLCVRCKAWGTMEALLLHGPLVNGLPLKIYPREWIKVYTDSEVDFQQELVALSPRTENGQMVSAQMMDAIRKGQSFCYEDMIIETWQVKTGGKKK